MFNPRERSQLITWRALLFIACLLFCQMASAAPSITLCRKAGPPTSLILVSGRGFEPNVGVDIFFDTKLSANAGALVWEIRHPQRGWALRLRCQRHRLCKLTE